MVFIAFPTLQRSQRDTTRRTDLGRMSGFISNHQTNNNGRLPSDGHKDAVKDADEVALADEWQCSRVRIQSRRRVLFGTILFHQMQRRTLLRIRMVGLMG